MTDAKTGRAMQVDVFSSEEARLVWEKKALLEITDEGVSLS
jgi:hypothetical protein